MNKQKFSSFCIYAPSQCDSTSEKFYSDLLETTEKYENSIIIGNFNKVLGPELNRKDLSKIYKKPKTLKLLTYHMLEHAMVDPWRSTYPQKIEFSWENTSGAAPRIDYSLVPAHLYHQVAKSEYYIAPIHTDHKVFEMQVNLDKFRSRKGYPKVKNYSFCDPDFVTKISDMISETKIEKHK